MKLKCGCDQETWDLDEGETYPEPCKNYHESGGEGMCWNCGHQEACHVAAAVEDSAAIIQRLHEMEYAVDGGNLARENVPAGMLTRWFRYVWAGSDK